MINKSVLYKEKQLEICDKIIEILDLDEYSCTTLYDLENNQEKKQKIIEISSDIRKYFLINNIRGVKEPEKTKRAWLSIIKQITKLKYKLLSSDCRIILNNKKIRTKKYIFVKL